MLWINKISRSIALNHNLVFMPFCLKMSGVDVFNLLELFARITTDAQVTWLSAIALSTPCFVIELMLTPGKYHGIHLANKRQYAA